MSINNKNMTMGVIVGNRGFFPDHLAKSGREEMLRALKAAGIDAVALDAEQSKYGAVETREVLQTCAAVKQTDDFVEVKRVRKIVDTYRIWSAEETLDALCR